MKNEIGPLKNAQLGFNCTDQLVQSTPCTSNLSFCNGPIKNQKFNFFYHFSPLKYIWQSKIKFFYRFYQKYTTWFFSWYLGNMFRINEHLNALGKIRFWFVQNSLQKWRFFLFQQYGQRALSTVKSINTSQKYLKLSFRWVDACCASSYCLEIIFI